MSLSKKQNRLQTQKANLQLPKQEGARAGLSLGLARHTTVYKVDKQQGPTVQHRGKYSISSDKKEYEKG